MSSKHHSQMTVDEYHKQQADCDGLCQITGDMVNDTPDLMRCVTCPFCKEIVDAILTKDAISCPRCGARVDR